MRAQVEEQLSQSQLSDPDQPGGFAQNTGTGSEPSRTQGPPPGIPPPSARYVDEIEHQQEQSSLIVIPIGTADTYLVYFL